MKFPTAYSPDSRLRAGNRRARAAVLKALRHGLVRLFNRPKRRRFSLSPACR